MNTAVPLSDHNDLDNLVADTIATLTAKYPVADREELARNVIHAVIHELGLRHEALGSLTPASSPTTAAVIRAATRAMCQQLWTAALETTGHLLGPDFVARPSPRPCFALSDRGRGHG